MTYAVEGCSLFLLHAVFIYICGACSSFMMICGSSFKALLQRFIMNKYSAGVPAFLSSRWLSIVVPSTAIILPLSLLPNMTALAVTSTLAFFVYSFNIAAVSSEFFSSVASEPAPSPIVPPDAQSFNWSLEAFKAVPLMIFAYQCHIQSVPVFFEMTPRPQLLSCGNRGSDAVNGAMEGPQNTVLSKLRGAVPVFVLSFAQCTVLYITMGLSGYFLFPVDTESNILNNFSVDNNLMMTVRILVGFAVSLHYPIDLQVARTALYDLTCEAMGKVPVYPIPYKTLAACTVVIWGGSLVLACVLTDLGQVFQVLGGVACSLIMFILPGLMLLCDSSETQTESESRGNGLAAVSSVPSNGHDVLTTRESVGSNQAPLLPDQAQDNVVECASPTGQAQSGDAASALLSPSVGFGPDCATKVLAWTMVNLGSCIMCLTVYLTLFGK